MPQQALLAPLVVVVEPFSTIFDLVSVPSLLVALRGDNFSITITSSPPFVDGAFRVSCRCCRPLRGGHWVFIAPPLALPDDEVGAKLDTMLLLTVVEAKGQPRALPTEVDGAP